MSLTPHAPSVYRKSDNIVEVHYSMELEEKITGAHSDFKEMHFMRYWFMPELHYLAKACGFKVVGEGAWMPTER